MAKLLLARRWFTDASTIGQLYWVDGKPQCYILEDVDRGLDSKMPLEELKKIKVHGKTCIPYGEYEIILGWSDRFARLIFKLLDVPAYEGTLIHAGNVSLDTDGCLLTGTSRQADFVGGSVAALKTLSLKLVQLLKTDRVFLTIQKGEIQE